VEVGLQGTGRSCLLSRNAAGRNRRGGDGSRNLLGQEGVRSWEGDDPYESAEEDSAQLRLGEE